MPVGGCFCGKTRIEYTGEIQAKASASDDFKVTSGTPKTLATKADSGKTITSHFCGDCGSTLFREGETFGDARIIKVGIMDDVNALNDAKPGVELYAPERVSWVKEVEGAEQKQGMP
ncbi:hypothetical protein LTR66_005357 [Elasticomyces elasticus]|nr:hypothetical protein LTR66_005357 [Elasticomyces elasticus]